jgi:acylphosphatase
VVCKRVRYSGRVQGVGFRYTVQGLAEHYSVCGFVRNLPGGDVELVADGPDSQVADFLAAISRRMAGYIESQTEEEHPPVNQQGFGIRY